MCDGPDLFLCILAVLFPPIAVWVKRGLCSADSFINIALCILGYIPGLLHAWYIVSTYPSPAYEQVPQEESQVHVYYVSGGPPPPSAGPTAGAHSTPQTGYGTIAAKKGSSQPSSGGQSNGTTGGQSAQSQTQPQSQSQSQPQPQSQSQQPRPQEQMTNPATKHQDEEGLGAGPSDGAAPPSYSDVVRGDHKIQSHE